MPLITTSPAVTNNQDPAWSALFGGNLRAFTEWQAAAQQRAALAETTPLSAPLPLPSIINPASNTDDLTLLCERVKQFGFALYEWTEIPHDVPACVNNLLRTLSLHSSDSGVIREVDGLSRLQDLSGTPKGRFPPYQASAMNWHTDGYYNAAEDAVRCFTLHCVAPAAQGGALYLMDDALLILALLQDDPELLRLLAHPQAMTLPSNQDTNGHDRPDRTAPMLQQNNDGSVAARFTTRARNIHWRCSDTQAAATRATELIEQHSEWHTRVRLQRGQGVITRNILHAREQFTDLPTQPKRQMLRGRFPQLPTTTDTSAASTSTPDTQHALH